ncbi:MAG: T9SS type A sorting domain-containing protein, partial [Melioribacteraceae bacterium]|nr:T9SS type A sorting domain-containing protein [Melioribacteraceae bacterium]
DPSNQRRLAVGFLENNVVGGLVDGKYWPKNYINTNSNVDATSPREWLFIFDEDYSEQYDSRYETQLIASDMRIMYTAIWNRRGEVGFSPDFSGQDRIQFIPNIPLTDNDSYVVTPNECTMDLNVLAGWNLLSLPFQDKNMNIVSNIFTNNTSPAYNFRGGFSNSVNLWPASGFFIRNQIPETIPFKGNLFGITTWLNNGWNLIGTSKWALDVTKLETFPHNVIATPFYQFNNGYQVATTLQPGKGYWVKANSYCDISLLPVPFLPKSNSIMESYDIRNFAGISIIDSKNSVAKLYLADSETGEQYELPPIPPSGIFDVRFSSNKSAENISGSWKTILINSAQYPLTINSEKNILIRDYTGVEIKLIAGEQFKITNPNIERLQIKDIEIPVEYTLMQNYPNPFNPTTTIKFGIPEKTNVQLEIFSLIGERIAEPINKVLEAGYHEINWDASHLASGIFIYKIITNNFISVKKMIYIK